MEKLLGALAGFVIVIFILVIGIYIAQAIFLNKFNKLVNGKGTPMAWIPIFNIYLLGKLTINKLVGWILVICIFLTGTYSTTVNGVESSGSILPEGVRSVVSTIYGLAVLGLFIYAIIKYNKIKKEGIGTQTTSNYQTSTQPVQPTMNSTQPVQPTMNPTQSVQPTINPTQPVQSTMNPTQPVQPTSSDNEQQTNSSNNTPFNNGIM